jgi:hypothetical protein
MKLRDYLCEAKWPNSQVFKDEWTLEDDDGNSVNIEVDIFYESSGGKGKNLYYYPLTVRISKDFKFDGKTYRKNTEFPDKIGKYVNDRKRDKYEEWLYNRVNEVA